MPASKSMFAVCVKITVGLFTKSRSVTLNLNTCVNLQDLFFAACLCALSSKSIERSTQQRFSVSDELLSSASERIFYPLPSLLGNVGSCNKGFLLPGLEINVEN